MVSLNSVNSVTKIFDITLKGLEPATQPPQQDATTAPAGHMRETRSLNLAKFTL